MSMALTEIVEFVEEVEKDTEIVRKEQPQNGGGARDQQSLGDNRIWRDFIEIAVAVGKGSSSLQALKWVLQNQLVPPGSLLHLLHIQAPLRFIPSPMGNNIPLESVSEDVANRHKMQRFLATEQLLYTYKKMCDDKQVNSEVIYAEGDVIQKELVNQIISHCIAKLVIGTSSQSRISRALKKQSIATSVLKNAPSFCKVVVVCNGKVISKGSS